MFGMLGLAGGLSPCVRGTVKLNRLTLLSVRFIPVRTGNGVNVLGQASSIAVYPRAYGER